MVPCHSGRWDLREPKFDPVLNASSFSFWFSCCSNSGLPVRTYPAHKYVQPRSVGEWTPPAPPLTIGGENSSMTAFLFPPLDRQFWNTLHRSHWRSWEDQYQHHLLYKIFFLPALISLPQYSFLQLTLCSALFLTLLSGKPRLNTSRIYLIHYSLLYNAVWTQLFFNWIVPIYYIKP